MTSGTSADAAPPLGERYSLRVALMLCALTPFLVLSTGLSVLQERVTASLGASMTGVAVAEGLANAGYAFGAVAAIAIVKRARPRPALLSYGALFVLGAALSAVAGDVSVFAAGRLLQGLATGLLLVAVLPPLVTRFGVEKLPVTVALVDLGLFGAVALGPLVGAWASGSADGWRVLFVGAAGVVLAGAAAARLSMPPGEPLDPEGPIDHSALLLAAGATVLPFVAVSLLRQTPLVSPQVLVPLGVGLVLLAALLVAQYRRRDALTPLRQITHTVPLTGLVAAMTAGAVAVATIELVVLMLLNLARLQPLGVAAHFWPAPVAVAVAAAAFGVMLRTRHVPVLVQVGMAALLAAAVLLAVHAVGSTGSSVLLVTGLVGFGAGATVSPGLFQAAFAIPSRELGPTFALVELLRSEAAFLVAPIVLYVVTSSGTSPAALHDGIVRASWVVAGIAGFGIVASLVLPLLGGTGLEAPDLDAWMRGDDPAVSSSPVGAVVRPDSS
jgi:MFS family permease